MMSDPAASLIATFACPSCGTESVGRFCRTCGEQKLGTEDRPLRHCFDIVINFLTHFDSKGYRSLWLLVTRPGFLSCEQIRGSRVRYLKPLALFLSVNIVYYFSIACFGGNTFTTPLETRLRMNDYYPAYASAEVGRKIEQEGIGFADLEARFNAKTSVLSRTPIFFFIPIYAALFFAFFFRSPGRFFVEHMVVATHFWSFVLVLLAVAVPVVVAPFVWWTHERSFEAAGEVPLTVFLQLCIGAYLAVMLRHLYTSRLWYCVIVASVIGWSFFHILWLYRFLLVVITMHTL